MASTANRDGDGLSIGDLNILVMSLPFAEAHTALSGKLVKYLPLLGEDISLEQHIKDAFFAIVNSDREAFKLTEPVLISGEHLVGLEYWQEWRTLFSFLSQFGLCPCVVFRNTPIVKPGVGPCYVADVRVTFQEA